jgi:hypothetical protein
MEYQELTPVQILQLENEKDKIEKEVARITYSVEIGKDLTELKKDPKFIKVFDEFYLKEEVVRETMLLSEKYFLEADQRQSLQDGLIAKAHFNDWLSATTSMEALSASRLIEHANRLREINDMLTRGFPLIADEATPPEGVPNGR